MQKFIVSFLITAILSYAFGLFLPWWSIAIAGLVSGLSIKQKPLLSFLSAMSGVFLLWSSMSFIISTNNDHLLATKISLMVLKNNSPFLLVLVTGMIGGLTSGISALSGRLLSTTFQSN